VFYKVSDGYTNRQDLKMALTGRRERREAEDRIQQACQMKIQNSIKCNEENGGGMA